MNKRIYLCGPIHNRSDADCNGWRQRAAVLWGELSPGGAVLDPMRRDARGRMDEPGIEVEIVEADKRDVDFCHGLLVYFDSASVGTSMEIHHAWNQGKPIVLLNMSGQPNNRLSLWLRYHCTTIVDGQNDGLRRAVERLHQHLAYA